MTVLAQMSDAVTWTQLIELLGVLVLVISGVIYGVWTMATGAKRCAADARVKVERAEATWENVEKEVADLKTDVREGFERVHERLDKFVGG